jgi:hypothetical protein
VGLGATSCIGNKRYSRPRQLADYEQWVHTQSNIYNNHHLQQGLGAWKPPWVGGTGSGSGSGDINKDDDQVLGVDAHVDIDTAGLDDIVLTRLRTADGLDLDWVRREYGDEVVKQILVGAELALDLGLALHSHRQKDTEEADADADVDVAENLSLTDPEGFLFSNTIISTIFAELGF